MAIDISEITSRMDNDSLLRVFDRDRDKQILDTDIVYMQKCLNTAENLAKIYLVKAFGEVLEPYDPAVITAIVNIALYEAVRFSPMHNALYRTGFDDAIRMFKDLRRDEIRPVQMADAKPSNQHTGEIGNETNASTDEPTGIWSSIASGTSRSGY